MPTLTNDLYNFLKAYSNAFSEWEKKKTNKTNLQQTLELKSLHVIKKSCLNSFLTAQLRIGLWKQQIFY